MKFSIPALCFFLVIVLRIVVVSIYGENVPFFDQWDIEGNDIYPKFLADQYSLKDLFTPHNEHSIVMTRLYLLGLFSANGHIWDPLLSMKIQTVVPAASCALLTYHYLSTTKAPSILSLFIIFYSFALPIGYDSLLWGVEIHWYFLIFFSIMSLKFASINEDPKLVYFCLAVFCSLLSFWSIASGFISLFIVGIIYFSKSYNSAGRFSLNRSMILGAIAMAGTFLLYKMIPQVASSKPLALKSYSQFPYQFLKTIGWPDMSGIFFYWIPIGYMALKHIKNKTAFKNLVLPISITGWLIIQAAAITVKRGGFVIRYADMFLLIVPVTVMFLDELGTAKLKKYLKPAIIVLLTVISLHYTIEDLAASHRERLEYKKTILEAVQLEKMKKGLGLKRLEKGPIPHFTPKNIYRVLTNPKLKNIWPDEYR